MLYKAVLVSRVLILSVSGIHIVAVLGLLLSHSLLFTCDVMVSRVTQGTASIDSDRIISNLILSNLIYD